MSKADKDGWIRHRGGKCPVEAGVMVDVRYRNGDVVYGAPALEWYESVHDYGWTANTEFWKKDNVSADIMAYRLHKQSEQQHKAIAEALSLAPFKPTEVDGPLQWRDRITEIDATAQALAAERAELVQKLASEGFALIGPVKADNASVAKAIMGAGGEFYSKPVEDMSDWRNWKVGDCRSAFGLRM